MLKPCLVTTITRSAGGRLGVGVGSGGGRPRPPSRKGVWGYHPREIFEILYRKRCIFTHCKVCQQYIFAFKIHVDCIIREPVSLKNIL